MKLDLYKGSVDPIYFNFVDKNDLPDNISGAARGSFVIKDGYSATSTLLVCTTDDASFTVEASNHRCKATPQQGDMDTIPVGVYIGEVVLDFGSSLRHTAPFIVEIHPYLVNNVP